MDKAIIVIDGSGMFCSKCGETVLVKPFSKKDPTSGPEISHHGCDFPFVGYAIQCEARRELASTLRVPEVTLDSVPELGRQTTGAKARC